MTGVQTCALPIFLKYDVQANVGGKIAQLGSRLIDGVAKKLADQFFANLANAAQTPAAS